MSNTKHTNAEALSFDHLRSFIAVVESGSQVSAARRLGIAQTTVSRHIDRVQEHFGGSLFEAGASGPLSTRGQLVEQSARSSLAELSRTRDRLALDRPVLRIGFSRALRPLVERALRAETNARIAPAFEVRLTELTSAMLLRALERRELDIAISYAVPQLVEREDLEQLLVAEEPFVLVLPERAWMRGKPSWSVLASLLYAHSPRYLSNRRAQAEQRWFREHRLVPERCVECKLGSEILAYAGAGVGYGFLPASWSMANHAGVILAPTQFEATASIAVYGLQHVSPWIARLRDDLGTAARAAFQQFQTP